jgi:hypothetical protein
VNQLLQSLVLLAQCPGHRIDLFNMAHQAECRQQDQQHNKTDTNNDGGGNFSPRGEYSVLGIEKIDRQG